MLPIFLDKYLAKDAEWQLQPSSELMITKFARNLRIPKLLDQKWSPGHGTRRVLDTAYFIEGIIESHTRRNRDQCHETIARFAKFHTSDTRPSANTRPTGEKIARTRNDRDIRDASCRLIESYQIQGHVMRLAAPIGAFIWLRNVVYCNYRAQIEILSEILYA